MKLLVDAHTLIWAVDDPSKLGRQAVTALQDPGNDLILSAGTIWEIGIGVWPESVLYDQSPGEKFGTNAQCR